MANASSSSQSKSGSSSKKRKHSEVVASSGQSITVQISGDASKNGLLPLLAATPAVALPDETTFTLYSSISGGKDKGKGKEKEKDRTVPASMLHGESAKLEWTSSNRLHGLTEDGHRDPEESADDTECSASYALALYDPSTSSLSVIPAPLHILSHIPKRLKGLQALVSDTPSDSTNAAARAALGLSFGTKKSIKAIRAAERNKVDAGAADLQDVQDVMMQGLDEGLVSLPAGVGGTPRKTPYGTAQTTEEQEEEKLGELQLAAQQAARTGRPVPNVNADRAEDVYRLVGDIMLDKELEAINPSVFMRLEPTSDPSDAIRNLPHKSSTWVNDRVLELVVNGGKDGAKKRQFKHLIWISALMAVKRVGKGGLDPSKDAEMRKKFGGGFQGNVAPPVCTASMLERFAEGVRGTRKWVYFRSTLESQADTLVLSSLTMTTASESRLLCFLFVACLAYDGYTSLDITLLANDLNLNPKRTTEVAKSLGCRVVGPKGTELDKIIAKWKNEGRDGSVALAAGSGAQSKVKVANLKIPLEFPRERKAKAKR